MTTWEDRHTAGAISYLAAIDLYHFWRGPMGRRDVYTGDPRMGAVVRAIDQLCDAIETTPSLSLYDAHLIREKYGIKEETDG